MLGSTTKLWRQKMTPPRAAFPVVPRTTVGDLSGLHEGVGLVVVQAPAGFGKTSLLRSAYEARRATQQRVVWLSLDPADNDPQRFLEYLDAALRQSVIAVPAKQEAVLDSVTELMASDQAFSLFLDDLHVITDAAVTGIIRDLIASIPEDGTLFLGGRRMPDLHIGRLRTQGQVLEIGADDLRFTTSEAEQLVANVLGRRLQPELITSLHERTDGWAAVLQLAALTLTKRTDPADYVAGFSASSVELGSYLTEEILADQTEDIRELMLRSSVCNTICADLCDEICDRSGSAELLARIESDNLCLFRLDPEGEWFHFHDLFADYLRRELYRHHRQDIPELHRRAAEWFVRNDLKTSALEHAVLCGDTDYAADIADEFAQPLTAAGRLATLTRAASPLPKAALDRRPRLKVYYTVCLSGTFQHRLAAPLLEELSAPHTMAALDPVTRGALLFGIPFHMVLQDRFADALTAAEAHIRQLDPADAQNRTALYNVRNVCLLHLRRYEDIDEVESEVHALATGVTTYGLVYAECIAGMSELAQGRLRNATATFEAALRTAIDDSSPSSAPTALAAACLAEALYEECQLERAEELLDRHLQTITRLAIPDGVIHAHALNIRITYRRHGYEQACEAIHQLKRLGYERDLGRVVASAWAEQSRLALLEGDLPAADRYLHMAEANGRYATLWDESSATLRARLLTAQGQPAAALELLDTELEGLDAASCRREALKIRVVRATVLKAAGRNTEARRVIVDCVQEAGRASFVRLLVDEGPPVAALLRELLARQTVDHESRVFIGILLEHLDDEHRAAAENPDEKHEKLSGRELEVLGHMADGLSNQAIAGALVVSLPTVKSHVRSILVKLAAKNRTEAVAKARQSNLLMP